MHPTHPANQCHSVADDSWANKALHDLVPMRAMLYHPAVPLTSISARALGTARRSHPIQPSLAICCCCWLPPSRRSRLTSDKVCHDDSALTSSSKRSCRPRSLADLAMCMCSPMWLGLRQHPRLPPPACHLCFSKFRFSSTLTVDGVQDPGFRFTDWRAGVSRPSC
ncbi:hypothetical protein FALCPG4_003392 [Fusarium falciforme]